MTDPRPSADPGRAAQVDAAVGRVWDRVRGSLLERVTSLEAAVAAVLEGRLDEDRRTRAERDAHKLAGSAGTFGRHRASVLARHLETYFAAGADHAGAARAAEQVELLRDDLEAAGATPPGPTDDRALVLFVSVDDGAEQRIRTLADARGLRVRSAPDAAAARDLVGRLRPSAVVLQPRGEDPEGLRLVADLERGDPPVPTIVLAAPDTVVDRVTAARAGARTFLSATRTLDDVLDAVAALAEPADDAPARVLAVDDDPAMLAALQVELGAGGWQVETLGDPLRFWATLEDTAPDLVVLDLDMPSVSGAELCRTVRSDPRWASLPVVFLTAHTHPEAVERVFSAGADDYVTKPLVGQELRTRVDNRLARVRLQRPLAESDPLSRARDAGGDRVEPVGWQAGPAAAGVDVAIVEDDAVLSDLLVEALDIRGHTSVRLSDGQEAADRLTGAGSSPQLRARVVLLDVDLPGLSGMAVLHRLSAAGLLEDTRVIMLTAHATEADVLAALERGAVDHIAKPFSLPVLLEKVRRALNGLSA